MKTPPQFKNRILSYGTKPADQFLANPKNPRVHPIPQREAMEEALGKVGFIAPVIETSDGYLLDGHERIYQALLNNSDVPFVVVDIHSDDADADYALATYDALTALGNYDPVMLDELLQGIDAGEAAIAKMLNNLWDSNTVAVYSDESSGVLPDEKLDIYLNATIKQVVLLFTNEQFDDVIPRLSALRQRIGAETNTELFLNMLEHYENVTSPASAD
jgi:hypothetical protein